MGAKGEYVEGSGFDCMGVAAAAGVNAAARFETAGEAEEEGWCILATPAAEGHGGAGEEEVEVEVEVEGWGSGLRAPMA